MLTAQDHMPDTNPVLSYSQYAGPDGKIPTRKFEDIVEQYRSSLSESTIRKLLQYADTNKDGYITKEELERFVRVIL